LDDPSSSESNAHLVNGTAIGLPNASEFAGFCERDGYAYGIREDASLIRSINGSLCQFQLSGPSSIRQCSSSINIPVTA
jgi:hypothetical protein